MSEELKAGRQLSRNFELSSGQPHTQLPDDLIKAPTVEKYRKIMALDYWSKSRRTIDYLREFELGLQGIEYLLRLTDEFKTELGTDEAKLYRWRLWEFYLHLLDKMDRWEDYLATVEAMKQNPEGQEFLAQSPPVLTTQGRKAYAASQDMRAFWYSLRNRFTAHDPTVEPLMTSAIENRVRLIKKKLARKQEGKSVKQYLHKRCDELTDEEYQRRAKVLKFWFEFPKKWEEWAKTVVQERMKTDR